MDAVGPGRRGNIDTVVDDDSRGTAGSEPQRFAHQPGQRARIEIVFTNLHDIDAAADGALDLPDQERRCVRFGRSDPRGEAAPISDEAKKPSRHHEDADA